MTEERVDSVYGKEIADHTFMRHNINKQYAEVTLQFADEDVRRMDRYEFRSYLHERLYAVSAALMAAWDLLYGE